MEITKGHLPCGGVLFPLGGLQSQQPDGAGFLASHAEAVKCLPEHRLMRGNMAEQG